MTDYTARRVLLKNSAGDYVVPYTEKMERDLSDISSAGTTALLAKVHTDGTVLQYWSANLTPTAGKTIALYESEGSLGFYLNTTGTNTATAPDQDATNWTMLPIGSGGANTDLSNLTATGNDKFVTKDTTQTITGNKTFSGTLDAVTPALSTDNSTKVPTTAWVRNHRCTTAATTSSSASVDAPAYVVENYKSGDNWYRKWSDGWIEQGGNDYSATTTYPTNRTINFHKAFTQDNPTVVLGCSQSSSTGGWHGGLSWDVNIPITKTGFSFKGCGNGNTVKNGCSWYACGY